MESIPAASTRPTRSFSSGERVARPGGLRSVTLGRLRSTTCTSSIGGLRWGLRHRLARNAALPALSMGLPVKPVQYVFPMAQEAAPMVKRQLSLAGFAEIASKQANRIRWETECESFLVRRRQISHSLRLSQNVISDSAIGGRLPRTRFDNGFLSSRLVAVAEAVRMWEASFAFHICIACFSSESVGIPGFPHESLSITSY